jgi:hypothetical protein
MYVHFSEPTFSELLDDPLVQLLMKSDGINAAALRSLLQDIRRASARNRDCAPDGPTRGVSDVSCVHSG